MESIHTRRKLLDFRFVCSLNPNLFPSLSPKNWDWVGFFGAGGTEEAAYLWDVFFLPSLCLLNFVLCTALNVFSWSFLESSETGGKTEVPIAIYFCFSVGVDVIGLIEVPTEGIRQQRKSLFFTVAKTLK